MALKWFRTGRKVSAEGTTILYTSAATDYQIQSRKRHIPHANGRPGTWDHTSYFVLQNGKELVEKHSLADAKEYVELAIAGQKVV